MALRVRDLEDWIIETRRHLHSNPELSFEEVGTSLYIRQQLDALAIPYTWPVAHTGIVGYIGTGAAEAAAAGAAGWGSQPGVPTVMLRADMDALPMSEPTTGVPYFSCNPGCMHACGHDAHMASLLGAARLLKEAESAGQLAPGVVRLVFQPGEEAGGGGKLMGEQGVFKGVGAAFALHVWPDLPTGIIASRAGPIMAGVISFKATIRGRGGHAAMPQSHINPVIAAASTIAQLRSTVTATLSPDDPVVVNVCNISGGTDAYNVVPDHVDFGGTIRAFSNETMCVLRQRLETVVRSQAETFGCTGSVDFRELEEPYFPPLINNAKMTDFAMSVARQVLGDEHVQPANLTMASEDFAFTAAAVPSCFAFLGIRNESIGSVHGLHSPSFKVDEAALKVGATYLASLAVTFLRQAEASPEQ
ncbi:hypothetical protein FOA52_015679 [Chlamydomonas sp. UWO 241]|nr:hypothetical protein FOA52_015679 [Chlamydomonas sp. UWO 241]